MIQKINAKVGINGHGGGVNTKPTTKKPGILQEIINANLVIGSYSDGFVRILKDRYDGQTSSLSKGASLENVISKTSLIISQCVFGKNDLTMFQEGLRGEIEEAVKKTIKKYHTKQE